MRGLQFRYLQGASRAGVLIRRVEGTCCLKAALQLKLYHIANHSVCCHLGHGKGARVVESVWADAAFWEAAAARRASEEAERWIPFLFEQATNVKATHHVGSGSHKTSTHWSYKVRCAFQLRLALQRIQDAERRALAWQTEESRKTKMPFKDYILYMFTYHVKH